MNSEKGYRRFPNIPPVDYSWAIDPQTRRQIAEDMYAGDRLLEECEQLNINEQTVMPSKLRKSIEDYVSKHLSETELSETTLPVDAMDHVFDTQDIIRMQLPWVSSQKHPNTLRSKK